MLIVVREKGFVRISETLVIKAGKEMRPVIINHIPSVFSIRYQRVRVVIS
jgi:hypothetical protein